MIQPIRLTETYSIPLFDCNNSDLNDFLFNDALDHNATLLAVTYLVQNNQNKLIGFFCVFNDNINVDNLENKKQFAKIFPYKKRKYKTYPAVKIGIFGIDKNFQKNGWGTKILDFIKLWFITNNKTGCRFITVDAYNNPDTLRFYQKNNFRFFTDNDQNNKTRSMYFDLVSIIDILK